MPFVSVFCLEAHTRWRRKLSAQARVPEGGILFLPHILLLRWHSYPPISFSSPVLSRVLSLSRGQRPMSLLSSPSSPCLLAQQWRTIRRHHCCPAGIRRLLAPLYVHELVDEWEFGIRSSLYSMNLQTPLHTQDLQEIMWSTFTALPEDGRRASRERDQRAT